MGSQLLEKPKEMTIHWLCIPGWPIDALISLLHPLQAVVDHSSYSQRPRIPAQEGDVMASGQTLQTVVDVVQRFLKQGGVPEHIVEVQVEQGDACGRTDGRTDRQTDARCCCEQFPVSNHNWSKAAHLVTCRIVESNLRICAHLQMWQIINIKSTNHLTGNVTILIMDQSFFILF